MALILNIDTATPVCSVALSKDGICIGFKELVKENSHSSLLTVMIEELLQECNVDVSSLHAVSVSYGPGSYTGLRIGVSVAKGMCYALQIPLIAVSTLQTIAYGIKKESGDNAETLFCPMIDARRMEVYTALYNDHLDVLIPDQALILDEHSFREQVKSQKIICAGDGSEKAKTVLTHPNFTFVSTLASARWMCELAKLKYDKQQFEDVAYFTPFYLKEFQTTVPRKKI